MTEVWQAEGLASLSHTCAILCCGLLAPLQSCAHALVRANLVTCVKNKSSFQSAIRFELWPVSFKHVGLHVKKEGMQAHYVHLYLRSTLLLQKHSKLWKAVYSFNDSICLRGMTTLD